jgi:cation diffusion facilitator family transporter
MIFSVIINAITSKIKIHFGKKENSISLLSDGVHDRVDVASSLAVLIGLVLTKYWIYADSVLAAFIGLYIIKESFSVGKEAMDSLLDVSASPEKEKEIRKLVEKKNIELASLKTLKRGSSITANLEIKLPKDLTVAKATQISNNLKQELIEFMKELEYVAIQITSHEIESSFYQPEFGRGFGWQQKGRFKGKIEKAQGKGPKGYCVCPQCGYKKEHEKGIPCPELKCPHCLVNLKRE